MGILYIQSSGTLLTNTHSFFTPFITSAIDFRYGYVFAGCNILAGLGVYLFVIEGQGRTLEEIDTMYLMGVKPWESSKFVMPDLDQMSGKVRQQLEQANPEIRIQNERTGDDMGMNEEKEEEGLRGSEDEHKELGEA